MDAYFARIEATLGPDPTDKEIVEAARVAFLALPEDVRRSINMDELRRRLAVYRSVEFG